MTPPSQDGQWGSWGRWDECSAQCGFGYRTRRRKCDNPFPQGGGQDCQGCHLDFELCNTHPCADAKQLSSWTPWLANNTTAAAGGHTEIRFRFSCHAPVADPALIKVSQAKMEERFCQSDGVCLRTGDPSVFLCNHFSHIKKVKHIIGMSCLSAVLLTVLLSVNVFWLNFTVWTLPVKYIQ
jgi:chondroitin sulfate proteoglycan 4